MGVIIKGCDCIKKEELTELIETDCNQKQPLNSITDVKINLKDFVRQRNENFLDVYDKLEILGQGSFGDVYKVRRKNDKEIRALKEIKKKSLKVSELKNEINILKKIDHPNIMSIYEFFEDENYLYIVMEYCNSGDLSNKMDDYGLLCEFILKYVMYQVFLAINCLHMKKVVHGDIKRENIAFIKKKELKQNNVYKKKEKDVFELFNEEKEVQKELLEANNINKLSEKAKMLLIELSKYEIKLVDFGCAKMKKENKKDKKLSGIIGTAFYCSPEVVKNNYDYDCDEWSCGVLMYILLSGIPPFDGDTEEDIFKKILNEKPNLDIPQLKHVSESCKSLISKLLEKDPNKRIKCSEVLKDEFFKNGIFIGDLLVGKKEENDEILKTFIKNKSERFGGTEKKDSKFKTAVIAYITLNFVGKTEKKKANEIYRQLSLGDEKHIISKKSFNESMKNLFDEITQEEVEKLFNDLDDNNNEEIEFHELIKGLCDQKKILTDKNLREAFNFFDNDSSGEITWNEIANVIFNGKSIPENVISEFLEEIGQNDVNISINYDEFKRIILNEQ